MNQDLAEKIVQLLAKRSEGPLTQEEEDILSDWVKKMPDEREVIAQTSQDVESLREEFRKFEEIEEIALRHKETILKQILSQMEMENPADLSIPAEFPEYIEDRPIRINRPHRRWIAAASILIIAAATVATTFLLNRTRTTTNVVAQTDSVRAVLTLADGKTINLKKNHVGAATETSKQNDSVLIYDASAATGTINKLSVPTGSQFKITLPDGTEVWMNAESTLEYPTKFEGGKRHVVLKGEAFFKIAPDKTKPFTVDANGLITQAIGTQFNVTNYDGKKVTTVLTEGSVKVSYKNESQFLVPGEQIALSIQSGQMNKSYINPAKTVAWMRNLFIFDQQNIEPIMEELSRWYGINVKFTGSVTEKYNGIFSRTLPLEKILDEIAANDGVTFELSDDSKTVIVSPK